VADNGFGGGFACDDVGVGKCLDELGWQVECGQAGKAVLELVVEDGTEDCGADGATDRAEERGGSSDYANVFGTK